MQTLELNGKWTVEAAGRRKREVGVVDARVPGDVMYDLLRAKVIPDPYERDRETECQWVGATEWVYKRTVRVPRTLLDHDRVLLRCEGLDTLATVKVNGKTVGETDNMFRTWEFDVADCLKAGENRLEVRFASTLPYIEEKQREAGRSMAFWGKDHKVPGANFVRKEQCNYGWDWGPKLVTCGIWRPLRLVAFNTARLADVAFEQDHSPRRRVDLTVRVGAETAGGGRLRARATVRYGGRIVAQETQTLRRGAGSVRLGIADPKLWWPNGLGDQPLYEVSVDLLDAGGDILDTQTRRLGLRTLALDRHRDEWGESFQFVVNGVPFFAKGANWIPGDAILARQDADRYRETLTAAAEANMNMLRVWGGGIYEADLFYELCDELGITVWQDFMFACATYPTFDKAWMKNVRAEAEDNVRRLRHHACLALWCGNNELEQGLVGPEWTPWQMSWADYEKLFDKLLAEVAGRLDPATPYWPCSPHTPGGDRREENTKDPRQPWTTGAFNPRAGDAHLWAVWHGKQPFEWYRTCEHRFNSEFGFQSFPEPKTVRGFTEKRDRNITAPVMEHHQRSGIGNTTIMQYMLDWFRLPHDFEMTLWASQILQGMAMKYAVEHWRRSMPRGMGTLYWQLNDCWPVASWASLDSHNRWKALHYMARNFYAPLLVSVLEDAEAARAAVHVTNDRREAAKGSVEWTLTTVAGKRIDSGRTACKARPLANTEAVELDLRKHVERYGRRDLLLWVTLKEGNRAVGSNFATLARPKELELANPRISTRVKSRKDGAFSVTLRSKAPALWTWLELSGADLVASDNFFHLRNGAAQTVVVRPHRALKSSEFRKRLTVRSLYDTYA